MKRKRVIFRVIKQCGLGPMTALFFILFLLCSIAVMIEDPSASTLGDGLWYSFQAVTTIGFGDIVSESNVVRIFTVCLSTVSIFYLALLTGGVVSYCNEVLKIKRKGTFEHVFEKLENLENLPHEELAEISAAARRYHDSLGLESDEDDEK